MSKRLQQLASEAIEYDERPVAPVNILEEGGSPWRAFRHDPKILRPDVADVIERAFDCGGFVAGGCGRWLRNAGIVTPSKRGAYVHEGGDIDLFFKSETAWREFLAPYAENMIRDVGAPVLQLSKGKLAVNLAFATGPQNNGKFSSPPVVQAIRCVTGTLEEVIRSFDFVNSMVAFDRDRVWVAEGWERFEREKTLGIARWGSRSVVFRVLKYMNKYGYSKFEDVSGNMFEQLVAVTDKMTADRQRTSRDVWYSILLRADMPLETKLLILASTAKGIDTDDLFNMQRAKPVVSQGGYESFFKALIVRHERAKARAQQKRLNPPPKKSVPKRPVGENIYDLTMEDVEDASLDEEPDFDADEYCWAR